jgi:enoyl-CoA hydratase
MTEQVLTQRHDGVLVITLNRPQAFNAITTELTQGLLGAIEELDTDSGLVAGVITGSGRGFCSGMDLKAFDSGGGKRPEGFRDFIAGAQKPLVAAVEGFALAGGLEIALTCDLLVAARGAKLGLPEVSVGLFAAAGGIYRVANRLPYGVAMELALTGDPITAEVAFDHGLVTHLVERGEATAAAISLAERIARNGPLAVNATKQLVRASHGRTEEEFFAIQSPHIDRVFTSSDGLEGPRAFAEKRPPVWTGS